MRLTKYYTALSMSEAGATVDDIQKETGLQTDEILHIQSGSRIPPVILFQQTNVYERCPECGQMVMLPCCMCAYRRHADAPSIDVIKRPIRNQKEPADIALDYQLLDEE